MQRKNKVMLAAAIGMVAVIIGSTAVRCSIAHTVEESAGSEAQDAGSADVAGAPPASDESAEIAKMLQGNVWQAEGAPERTVEFRDRSFVESDGTSVKLTVFDVKEAGEGNGQKHLDIDFMREGDPCTTSASIIVEETDGVLTVASDAFAMGTRYVQGKPAGAAVGGSGLAEPYTGLIDGKAGELASAVGSWCASHAPSATTASFDGEVYLDVRGGRVSACGDAARAGLPFTLHTDTPVLRPNLLEAAWCAVNRITKNGVQLDEDQKVTPYEAMRAITYNGAYQYGEEAEKGTLEAGKLADLVVLDRNPLAVDPREIRDIKVLATIKEGEVIYRRDEA